MYLTSSEGYKNAEVDLLIIKKTGEIWTKIKDVQNRLDVQNIPDLVLKEIYRTKEQIKKYKTLKEKFLKSLII